MAKLKHPLICLLSLLTLAVVSFAQGNDDLENRPEGPQNPRSRSPRHVSKSYAFTGPVGYVPSQIRHAYALDLISNQGTGQTIGIVVAYGSPTLQKDLDVFCQQFGIPTTAVQIIYGKTRPKTIDQGWALETSMDVQWAHAIAPKAKIIVSVAASPTISNLVAAVDNAVKAGAKIISMSWGANEFSTETSYETYFTRSGVSYFASSGDSGSTAGTSWPATSPNVTSVGGTSLYLDASGNLTADEVAWSGSGGGFSLYFNRPTYQNGWHTNAKRSYPDVSMVANPSTGAAVYNSTPYSGSAGWWQVGGTSLSCPITAATFALANEQRVAKSKATLSGFNSSLYKLAASTASGISQYPYFFYDVTVGNTGNFSATPLLDQTTGLGSPVNENIVPAISNL